MNRPLDFVIHWFYNAVSFARRRLVLLVIMGVVTGLASAADKPADITGGDANTFHSHLGHVISLRGRLEDGMQGPCLYGATPTNVVFYVIPDMARTREFTFPKVWTRLMHQQVRVTGELKFQAFERRKASPSDQIPPDYYYMVFQRTKIERLESK